MPVLTLHRIYFRFRLGTILIPLRYRCLYFYLQQGHQPVHNPATPLRQNLCSVSAGIPHSLRARLLHSSLSLFSETKKRIDPSTSTTKQNFELGDKVMAGVDKTTKLRDVYPEIEPFETGWLKVSDIHALYYEQCGNKDGKPVIFIHGGPGGGVGNDDRRFFDPEVYRIILFDQRGSGKSTPAAELKDNTTWHLVEDIEKLRKHLEIDRWVVFGGSWGSSLSLAYAQKHPDRVKAMVMRGIFTLRRRELLWFYQDGASMIYPDYWDEYLAEIPEVERGDIMSAYYRRLTSDDEQTRLSAAKAWSRWEMATSRLYVDEEMLSKPADKDVWALQFARIECHYFVNGGFWKTDSQLLDNVDKIRHIPTTIVQGRYDMVCPMETAWKLHKNWPEAEFHVVADAGHSAKEPGNAALLVEATDKYRHL